MIITRPRRRSIDSIRFEFAANDGCMLTGLIKQFYLIRLLFVLICIHLSIVSIKGAEKVDHEEGMKFLLNINTVTQSGKCEAADPENELISNPVTDFCS